MEENVFLIWQNHLTGTRIPDQSVDIRPYEDYPAGLLMPDLEYDIGESADHLLRGWIYNCMSEEVFSQILCCDIANELWNSLLEYYDVRAKCKEIYNRQTMERTIKGGNVMFNRGRNHESRPTCQPRNIHLSALTATTENLNDQRCNPKIGNDYTSKEKIMNGNRTPWILSFQLLINI